MIPSRVKNNGSHLTRNLIILILASIAIVVLSFIGITWGFAAFFKNTPRPLNWDLLSGFTSVISLAVLAGGLTFALFEYVSKEKVKARERAKEEREKAKLSFDIYQAINNRLTAPEQESARRWNLSNI